MSNAQVPIVNAGEKYLYGMNLSRTSNTVIAAAAGECRDSTNVVDILFSAAGSCDISTNGANGLDTGTVAASTFYAVYAIADSSKHNDPAMLLSTSFSSPTLPFGYDVMRRIGAVLTDGSSHILQFQQYDNGKDRAMWYEVAISELSAGTSATYAAVDLATSVPPVRCEVIMLVAYTANSATNKAHFLPFGVTQTNGMVQFGYGVAAAQVGMARIPSALDSSTPKIQYKVDSASDALTLSTAGYVDQL